MARVVAAEVVAWISERKNVLSLVFYLLALLAWVDIAEERPRRSWGFYMLALGCYLLALLSKATACTLPAAMVLVLWFKQIGIAERRVDADRIRRPRIIHYQSQSGRDAFHRVPIVGET